MNIAVASTRHGHVSQHMGRSPGFMIFTVENDTADEGRWRQNTAGHGAHHAETAHVPHAQGEHRGTAAGHGQGAGHGSGHGPGHAGILRLLDDCEVVIAAGMGARMYENLRSMGITVLITDHRDAREAVAAYLRGELTESEYQGCAH